MSKVFAGKLTQVPGGSRGMAAASSNELVTAEKVVAVANVLGPPTTQWGTYGPPVDHSCPSETGATTCEF